MSDDDTRLGRLIEALTIFQKYPDAKGYSAQHDTLYAGPDPMQTGHDDCRRLYELGWIPNNEFECWQVFT